MGILNRFGDIMAANLNALLDKLEDPGKMVDQYLREARENLADVKSETAGVMAEEKAAKRHRDELLSEVEKYMTIATKAVEAGNDDDARLALEKKGKITVELEKAETVYKTAASNAEKMRQLYNKLVSDIQMLESRKANIKGMAAVAKTQETVNKMTGASAAGSDVGEAMDRMEQRTQERLDKALAEEELSHSAEDKDAEARLAKYMTGGSQSVDDELAALKASLAGSQGE